MKSALNALRKFYIEKKCLRVYHIRANSAVPEDRWRRLFITFFFALIAGGFATALARAFHFPEFLRFPISLLALTAGIEAADHVYLLRLKVLNPSDLEILRGLSMLELRALEDSLLLTRENFPGAELWKEMGRPLREGFRLSLHYWPVTLAIFLS
jgi:hypothetical protein